MSKKSQLITETTIGADIELFLQHRESGCIISAEGIIRGTKENPFQFKEGNPYYATSLDNVMAEFSIPPAKNREDFKYGINYAIEWIDSSLPKHMRTLAVASAEVPQMYLMTENAKLFGCDPDSNAWRHGVMNPKPDAIGNIRTCGGHVHIGYTKPNPTTSLALVRAMDVFLSLPSVLQEPDSERKTLYGKAGAFRYKPYGVEYRTISNYYVNSSKLMDWVFDNTMAAIDFVNSQASISKEEGEAIQAAINFNDKKLAETMCKYFGAQIAA